MFKAIIKQTDTDKEKVRYFRSESAYLAFVDHLEEVCEEHGIFTTRLATNLVITNPGGSVTELRPDDRSSFLSVD